MVFSFASVVETIYERLNIDERIYWILIILLHCMHPNINIAINLANWEFSEFDLLSWSCLPFNVSIASAHVSIVFH
jgi:hypothetical protein